MVWQPSKPRKTKSSEYVRAVPCWRPVTEADLAKALALYVLWATEQAGQSGHSQQTKACNKPEVNHADKTKD